MLWLNDTARIRVSKIVKTSDKFANVFASSSAKKQNSDEYEYSNWTATFVGKARQAFELVKEGSVLTLTKAALTNIPYDKEGGERVWNNVKLVVFDFEVYRNGTGAGGSGAEIPDDDDIPF